MRNERKSSLLLFVTSPRPFHHHRNPPPHGQPIVIPAEAMNRFDRPPLFQHLRQMLFHQPMLIGVAADEHSSIRITRVIQVNREQLLHGSEPPFSPSSTPSTPRAIRIRRRLPTDSAAAAAGDPDPALSVPLALWMNSKRPS